MVKKSKTRIPSGKAVIRKKKEKPGIVKCAICKKPLHGVPSLNVSKMRKLAKSKRRPSRPYGGNLCSSCTREIFKDKVRIIK